MKTLKNTVDDAWLLFSFALERFPAVSPTLAGRHIDEDKFGLLLGFENQRFFDVDAALILGLDDLTVCDHFAVGHIDKNPASSGCAVYHLLAGCQGSLSECM